MALMLNLRFSVMSRTNTTSAASIAPKTAATATIKCYARRRLGPGNLSAIDDSVCILRVAARKHQLLHFVLQQLTNGLLKRDYGSGLKLVSQILYVGLGLRQRALAHVVV